MRWLAILLVLLATGCPSEEETPQPYPDEREPCIARSTLRNVYFGDLHVHTAFSFDAWVFDVRNTPEDAYRFARGEPLSVPPGVQVQLDRPLDFAAVTDHAEYLGEVSLCTTSGSPAYESTTCQRYREQNEDVVTELGLRLTEDPPSRFGDVCGDGRGVRCTDTARSVWARIQEAAESAYDRSAECSFTSFVAFEYTAVTAASNLHRNVIFRNRDVPDFPASYFELPKPKQLFEYLERRCLEAGGSCDAVSIPHNANWSNGNLFVTEYPGASSIEEERAQASLRGVVEPLIEIFQHKGDGECMNGLSGVLGDPDELCDFEKLRRQPVVDCGDETGFGGAGGVGCVSRLDFLRGILLAGLKEEQRIGVNPYRLGVIASTDTHNGTPGLVDEASYAGHWGNNEDAVEKRLGRGRITPGGVIFNGGGLTAVWAEENSRNAIFDALKRREVYGTSGPRIALRFFGGDLPAGLCSDPALVEKAYEAGVPMGGTLREGSAPRFVVSALADPQGLGLERIQIIKGWLADDGPHAKVFDVASGEEASLDEATCEAGGGSRSLCAEWTDPEHDPSQPAWYYARVLEVPTCRWSKVACNALDEGDRPESCADPEIPTTIRERAWSSPIWR